MKSILFPNWKVILLVFVSCAVYWWFGYQLDRSHFYELLLCFTLVFGAYAYVLKVAQHQQLPFYLAIAVLFRVFLLFCTPPLSDDYFRFIWDGQLLANGVNPFDLLPTEVTTNFPNKAELLQGMNSPEYYTVYPPLAQWVYFASAKLSPNSIGGSIVVMRSIILLCEVGTIFLLPKLLRQLKIEQKNALWYSLNPLVIVELTGNLHFEGIVIFFLLLTLYLLVLHREKLAAIPWALAAATKLIPLFLLPILVRKLAFKKAVFVYLLVGILFIALWIPFYNSTFLQHFTQSVNLYYATFEFNASIYYLVRWIGFQVVGYNIIATAGSWLSKIALISLVLIQLREQNINWTSFFNALLFALSVYYAFALIVHPWYICILVFLASFTNYRFTVLWSALAVLSYWAYSNAAYQENYLLIALEYLLVAGLFIHEFLRNSRNNLLSLVDEV